MIAMRRAAIVLLALASSASICGPGFQPPAPDSCDPKNDTSGIAAIEIGSGINDDFQFVPWKDGDVAMSAIGGQGSPMLPVRFRITGSALPECLPQVTQVTALRDSSRAGGTVAALKTYARPDGSRITKTHYIVLEQYLAVESQIALTTTIRAVSSTATRSLFYDRRPADAGPPESCADAGLAPSTANGVTCGSSTCPVGTLCCTTGSCGTCATCPISDRVLCDGTEDCPYGEICCELPYGQALFGCSSALGCTQACRVDGDCGVRQTCTGQVHSGAITVKVCN